MKRFALILSAALASCDSHNPPKPQSTPIPEAELMKMMKYATEHHSVLLGAKYHLPTQTVQVITADYRSHQLLVWQALASPAPSEETMQQTIDRLSTTYKLPQDVLASLIMDESLSQPSRRALTTWTRHLNVGSIPIGDIYEVNSLQPGKSQN